MVGGERVLEARRGENAEQALGPEGLLLLTDQAVLWALGKPTVRRAEASVQS